MKRPFKPATEAGRKLQATPAVRTSRETSPAEIVREICRLREANSLGKIAIRDLIDEGRRY